MVAASRAKASDRATLLKKLFPVIKKHYKIQIPKGGKPVLETMLYAICLEDSTVEEADLSFKRLFAEFPDLNEVRVSTVGEIERAFLGQTLSEWRAFRVISVLKFIFDKTYAFEFESLRKKTLDLATKQLAKIKDLSPFVRDYTLHEVTGAHMIPIDTLTARTLVWLGLALPNQTPEQIGELMKGAVRKAEIESFVFTMRCLAADRRLNPAFDPSKHPIAAEGNDTDTAMDRLNELIKNGPEKAVRVSASKSAAPKKEKEAEKKPEVKGAAKAKVEPVATPAKKDSTSHKPTEKKPATTVSAKKPAKKSR